MKSFRRNVSYRRAANFSTIKSVRLTQVLAGRGLRYERILRNSSSRGTRLNHNAFFSRTVAKQPVSPFRPTQLRTPILVTNSKIRGSPPSSPRLKMTTEPRMIHFEGCPLNSFVERRVVINLPKAVERLAAVQQQFRKVGLSVEVFPAIDGSREKVLYRPNPHYGLWNIRNAALVATVSLLLNDCQNKRINSVFIAEDDAVFADNFNQVLAENLPLIPQDYETIFLACNVQGTFEHLRDRVYRLTSNSCFSTHAWICSSRVYMLLLQLLGRGIEPLDVTIAQYIFPRGKSYLIFPSVATQAPGYSYIVGAHTDYRNSIPLG